MRAHWPLVLFVCLPHSHSRALAPPSIANVFVIGEGKSPAVSLPKGKGISLTVLEERDAKKGKGKE